MKLQQEAHYKTLVQSSKQYEEEQDKVKVVERDEVEEALTEKLKLQRQFAQQLKGKNLHFLVSVERFHKPCWSCSASEIVYYGGANLTDYHP